MAFQTLSRAQVRTDAGVVTQHLEMDAAAFLVSLQAAVRRLEIRSEEALWAFALQVQNNARILAPVDTGRLRSSIQASKGSDGDGAYVDIGTNVEYAAFVEFGTRFQVAQPYLRPAIATALPGFVEGLRAA